MKLALCGLCILLVVIITVSYYFNTEGFYTGTPATIQSVTDAASPKLSAAYAAQKASEDADKELSNANAKLSEAVGPADKAAKQVIVDAKKDAAQKALIAAKKAKAEALAAIAAIEEMLGKTSSRNRPALSYEEYMKKHSNPRDPVNVKQSMDNLKDVISTPSRRSMDENLYRERDRQIGTPKVSISDTAYDAMELNQQSSLLKNIQKIIRNELLATRSTQPVQTSTSGAKISHSEQQGKEFKNASGKSMNDRIQSRAEPSNAAPYGNRSGVLNDMKKNSCHMEHCKNDGMNCDSDDECASDSSYIKKNEIPCWGCTLDY
jgi:F0F1-type ATP synthase membrane subunit b/b'